MRVPVSWIYFARLLYCADNVYSIVHLHHCSIKFNTLRLSMYDQLCTFSDNLLLHIPVPFVLAQEKKLQTRKSQTQLECFCLLLTAWNQTAFVDRIHRFMFTQVSQRDGGWLWKRKCSCYFVSGVIINVFQSFALHFEVRPSKHSSTNSGGVPDVLC